MDDQLGAAVGLLDDILRELQFAAKAQEEFQQAVLKKLESIESSLESLDSNLVSVPRDVQDAKYCLETIQNAMVPDPDI